MACGSPCYGGAGWTRGNSSPQRQSSTNGVGNATAQVTHTNAGSTVAPIRRGVPWWAWLLLAAFIGYLLGRR